MFSVKKTYQIKFGFLLIFDEKYFSLKKKPKKCKKNKECVVKITLFFNFAL